MTHWKCPACEGEFPSPADESGAKVCPWCSRGLRHAWERKDPLTTIAKTEGDSGEHRGVLARLFK